jgi:hypothetical protein
MDDLDPTADAAVHEAAANLGRARRHAIWLERIAAMVGTLAVVTAVLAVAMDPTTLWSGLITVAVGVGAWGVLRALALLLHLQVDRVLMTLADDDVPLVPST